MQTSQVAFVMQVLQKMEEKETEKGFDTLELKTGEKIKVLNRACIDVKIKDNMSVMSGKVGNKNMEVLRDSGCKGVIVKRELVDGADFIEKVGYMMMVDQTLIRAPIARIKIVMPFYIGYVHDGSFVCLSYWECFCSQEAK